MNAISHRFIEKDAIVVHDVAVASGPGVGVGSLSGGLFGLFSPRSSWQFPSPNDVLTFGTIGTLIVAAGRMRGRRRRFGVLAAALYGQGVVRRNTTGLARNLAHGRSACRRRLAGREHSLSGWTAAGRFPDAPVLQADAYQSLTIISASSPLPCRRLQMTMSAIDSWENGGCGP